MACGWATVRKSFRPEYVTSTARDDQGATGDQLKSLVTRRHEETGLTTWFGNLTPAWGRGKYHGATEPPYRGDDDSPHPPPLYGDGTKIENEFLDQALELAEHSQDFVNWSKGDIVLLDVSDIRFCSWSLADS